MKRRITLEEMTEIVKTLPISYYLKTNIPIRINPNPLDTATYYDPVEYTITLSYGTLALMEYDDTVDTWETIESAARTLLYHEISHVILTPKGLKEYCYNNFKRVDGIRPLPLSASEKATIINIFEDERIETILKDYYMSVNFKWFCKELNKYTPGCSASCKDAIGLFYCAVRYRECLQDPSGKILDMINNTIQKYKDVNSQMAAWKSCICSNYVDEIFAIFAEIFEMFAANPTPPVPPQLINALKSKSKTGGKPTKSTSGTPSSSDGNDGSGSSENQNENPEENPEKSEDDGENKKDEGKDEKDEGEDENSSGENKSEDDGENKKDDGENKKDEGEDENSSGENKSEDEEEDENSLDGEEEIEGEDTQPEDFEGYDTPGALGKASTDEKLEGEENDHKSWLDDSSIPGLTDEEVKKVMEKACQIFNKNKVGNPKFAKEIERIIFSISSYNKCNTGAMMTYSGGRINPRATINPNAQNRWFKREGGDYDGGGKIHLTVWCDGSGSYENSIPTTNRMIHELVQIEKRNPKFTFDIVKMNTEIVVLDKNARAMSAGGGNALSKKVFDVYNQMNKPTFKNYNIVLFDGNAYHNSYVHEDGSVEYSSDMAKNFRVWNHPNCCIISDTDNERVINRYCKQAKVKIINSDYADVLVEEVLNLLRIILV